jgi:heat shock protein HslJ
VHRAGLLLTAAVLLAACGEGRSGSPADPDIRGGWELTAGTSDGAALPVPAVGRATLDVEPGSMGGTSFCNHYSGAYRRDGDTFSVTGLGGTEMGCDPDVMAAEAAYLAALGAVAAATVEDGVLVLTGNDVLLRFSPVQPPPASDLVGTRWVLETVVEGDTASSTLGEPAVLVLADDGTLSGSTGCRILTGHWSRDGDRLTLPEVHADGDCPSDATAQDRHLMAVLDDLPAAEIDGARLTLSGSDGRGLIYRAGG